MRGKAYPPSSINWGTMTAPICYNSLENLAIVPWWTDLKLNPPLFISNRKSSTFSQLKVREGRWAADFPKLCVFLNRSAISKHIGLQRGTCPLNWTGRHGHLIDMRHGAYRHGKTYYRRDMGHLLKSTCDMRPF